MTSELTDSKVFVKTPWRNPASGAMAEIGGYCDFAQEPVTAFVKWYARDGHTMEIWTFKKSLLTLMKKALIEAGKKQVAVANELSLQNKL